MDDKLDPLIDRLLRPTEELAGKVDKIGHEVTELKTGVTSLINGQLLERVASMETRINILFTVGGIVGTAMVGAVIRLLWVV